MLERREQRHGCRPRRHLVDGGFHKNDDTEWAAERGIRVYGPPPRSKHKTDSYAPRPKDGPGVAAWRRRMKSAPGKTVYRRRAMGGCINARFSQLGLTRFTVRDQAKVVPVLRRSQEHTPELQSLMRSS